MSDLQSGPAPQRAVVTDETTMWVTDAEMIRRMGAPEKITREVIRMLDRDQRSGFPRKQKLWGDRRYWPAVRSYLDKRYGVGFTNDAARVAPESRTRDRLPRPSFTEPTRRASNGQADR